MGVRRMTLGIGEKQHDAILFENHKIKLHIVLAIFDRLSRLYL